MDRSALPPAAFAAPDGSNRSAVERFVGDALRVALDAASRSSERPPLPDGAYVSGPVVPEVGVPEHDLLRAARVLVGGAMNPAHPGFMGHMDPLPATASVVGDLLAATVNNNMLSREMSPSFSRLEDEVTAAMSALFGLGDRAGGVLASGGSLANLHALSVARNARLPGVFERGLTSRAARPVVVASEAAHTSAQKAAMLLGLGTDAVRPVAVDGDGRMRVDRRRETIRAARDQGDEPFAVVATAGTTTTGAIDPLDAVADVAAADGLWLHVDAAYGGALVFSDRARGRLRGVERADSVTFNPQKWCYVAKTAAMALFRDAGAMHDAFRVAAPYMREGDGVNLGEVGVQGTRHADVLKLWMTLQHLGRSGLGHLVDEGNRLAETAVAEIDRRPFLVLAARPDMNVVCFRGAPDGLSDDEADAWNAALQASLLREARVFLSLPRYRGRLWLRAVFLNPYTETSGVETLFEHVDAFARSVPPTPSDD